MRANLRITWLLLSLSFLLHSVCSNNTDPVTTTPTTVVTGGSTSTNEPTTVSKTDAAAPGTTKAPPNGVIEKKNEPTQVPATTKPATMPAVKTTPSSQSTVESVTQPSTPIVTNNPVTNNPPAITSDAAPAVSTTASAAATSDSGVVATTQKSEASVSSKISVTETPVTPPGKTSNVGTTQVPEVTATLTPGQQSVTPGQQSVTPGQQSVTPGQQSVTPGQQSVAPTTTPAVQGYTHTDKTTLTVPSKEQTTARAPEPAGNTQTTSIPSTPTKAGPPAAETPKAGTMSPQTTPSPAPATTTTTTKTTIAAQPKMFSYSLNKGQETEEEKDLVEVCKRLMPNLQDGNCTLTWRHHNGKVQFDNVEINGKVKTSLATQYYEEITKKPTDNKTLIAILASCGALLIMIVILAVCASHHRKPYNENQQHLTEELHTVENGYHDNPTLEVMEVQPEMQEKKMALNGEFNDSWIVPIDNLLKEDIPDEEDTHL